MSSGEVRERTSRRTRRAVVRRALLTLSGVSFLAGLYMVAWPVPIDPVAWRPPPDPGHTGVFERNQRLAGMDTISIGDNHGPEAVLLGAGGRIYVATEEWIVRLQPDGSSPENWVRTGGRALGMAWDGEGNLIVADALRGLLSISPRAEIVVLAAEADGIPIRYADDVDVAPDGRIYFSDASTRFTPPRYGTLEASTYEILEHAGTGRLLVYDPATRVATAALTNLVFANGVAMGHDGSYVLVSETGSYRVLRLWIDGPRSGEVETLIDGLPGFPDNVTRGKDGRYWIALFAPRDATVDAMAGRPWLRKLVLRLPSVLRPKVKGYGHIIAVDEAGNVVADLQDPDGGYPANTSVLETADHLFIGSLSATYLARLPKSRAGLTHGYPAR